MTGSAFYEAERALLNINGLDSWRETQKSILAELRSKATDISDAYVKEFDAGIESSLDEYLQNHDITRGSSKYASIRRLYRDASIDRINDEHWYTSPAARQESANNTKSGREDFAERIKEM